MSTPLLGLVMIVKNEAHGIVDTLLSFKPFIDRWTILDTGSTDGTQDLISTALAGISGTLYEEPFVDFSTSRNRALELHGQSTSFTIMADADDRLLEGQELRDFCRDALCSGDPAYLVQIRRGDLSYFLPLVLRTTARWRYVGLVHEHCSQPGGGPPASIKIPSVALTQATSSVSIEASRARWRRDLALFRADLVSNPRNSRSAFYLAQTLECLGDVNEAVAAYQRRVDIGGWPDETFEAMFRRARILESLQHPWAEVQQLYMEAHLFDPRRAEPLYQIARHWHATDSHALTYTFASRAAAIPLPDTTMFVDADVYEWKAADLAAISAFYLSDRTKDSALRSAGQRASEQAVAARPSNERLRNNWSFYSRSAAEMFPSFRHQRIPFDPDPPFSAMNPSIWYDRSRWRCVIRATNYKIVDGKYKTPGDNVILSRNYMAELTDDLKIDRVVEMVDRDTHSRSAFPVHGFEDCRLFSLGDQIYCTATVCDFSERGMREIALLTLDRDYAISDAKVLRGPWSDHHQKNWIPLVHADGFSFIYSTKPDVVLPYRDGVVDASAAETLRAGRLRGSSQAVHLPSGGWLFVAHDVAFGPERTYLHRFVQMSESLKVECMSDPFFFAQRGIEFCAGLGYDGQRLVASFSVNDGSACLGVFDLGEVLSRLRHDYVV